MLTVPRSCLLAAQTIYESKNVAVEGFPQAAVIDKARFRNVYNANAERLEDEQVALDNHKLWQLVTVPAEAVRQCEHYGVEPEEAEAGAARAAKAWADFFELFFEDTWRETSEPVPMQITITKNLVPILKFNENRGPEDEVRTNAEELMEKLSWLDYASAPSLVDPMVVKDGVATINSAIESRSRAERRTSVGANEEELLKMHVEQFTKHFCIGGKTSPTDIARMQLARLLGEGDKPRQPVPMMVMDDRHGKLWFHFAHIVLNDKKEVPEWFPNQTIKEKFSRFVALLTDEGLPEDDRWTEAMVTKAQNIVERLLQERNDRPKNDKPKKSDRKRRQGEDDEAEEDSEDEEPPPLKRQKKQKSPKASNAVMIQPPRARPTPPPRVAPGVVQGDEVDPIAYDISLKADHMISLINESKNDLVQKIDTLSDRVSAAQTTGSGSVAALENKLNFALSAIKMLLAGAANQSTRDMQMPIMAARMMMETRLVGANGFTKEELDELFGTAEQAVQQNKTAQP